MTDQAQPDAAALYACVGRPVVLTFPVGERSGVLRIVSRDLGLVGEERLEVTIALDPPRSAT